jgi:predicted nucleic acid-binding protein
MSTMKRLVDAGALVKIGSVPLVVPQSPVSALRHHLAGNVCFDTTIPLHFAQIDLHGLLLQAFYGRAVVPWAVRDELVGLTHNPQVGTGAARLLAANALPRIIPSDPELAAVAKNIVNQIAQLRQQLSLTRGQDIPASADRGEAAAIAICQRYAIQPMSLLAQDGLAKRAAAKYGIPILGAAHALLAICLAGFMTPEVAWVHYLEMSRRGLAHREFAPNPDGRKLFLATFAQLVALGDK